MKINNFQGELTDTSAKKEALVVPGSLHQSLPTPADGGISKSVRDDR